MKILLAYATNSGGTYLASQIVEDELKKKNHQVTVKKIAEVKSDEFNNYDLVIFGSPTWLVNKKDGMPHDQFSTFLESNKDKKFARKQFAIFGLGDSSYMRFCGVVDHLEVFVKAAEGNLLVPSLRVDGFYFNPQSPDLVRQWAAQI